MQPNPLAPDRVEIKKADIVERRPSKVSPMPEGLLNQFTQEEILDLVVSPPARKPPRALKTQRGRGEP